MGPGCKKYVYKGCRNHKAGAGIFQEELQQ